VRGNGGRSSPQAGPGQAVTFRNSILWRTQHATMASISSKTRSERRPKKERRKQPGAPGSIRWLGGILGRPLSMESGTGGPRIVLVERRKIREPNDRVPTAQMCEELRARLLGHELENATRVMRHLVLVHDQLTTKGWTAVSALPSRVLGLAVVQAQMLTAHEPSLALAQLTDRLRVVKVEVELREERQRNAAADRDVEISEVTHEEFTRSAMDWQASQAPDEDQPPEKQ